MIVLIAPLMSLSIIQQDEPLQLISEVCVCVGGCDVLLLSFSQPLVYNSSR